MERDRVDQHNGTYCEHRTDTGRHRDVTIFWIQRGILCPVSFDQPDEELLGEGKSKRKIGVVTGWDGWCSLASKVSQVASLLVASDHADAAWK
jgi:hypothetical protein